MPHPWRPGPVSTCAWAERAEVEGRADGEAGVARAGQETSKRKSKLETKKI